MPPESSYPPLSPEPPLRAPLLQAVGVSMTFPGLKALDSVDFTLRTGEIHTLMGENGAGKSTLIKLLTGVYRRDGGDVLLAGKSISPRSPLEAQNLGISTVYQEVNLAPNLSVTENVTLGRQPMKWGRIDQAKARQMTEAAIARLGLNLDVDATLSSYSVAIQQLVAIARALFIDAKVLILDEPTSSLDADEVERLFTAMRGLRDEGLGILFVTHFLDQVYAVSDQITILRNGKLVGSYPAAELSKLELVSKMIGRSEADVAGFAEAATKTTVSGDPILEAEGLGRGIALGPRSFIVHKGEVYGLAGLLGSGRTETARLLFGLDRPDTGSLKWKGTLTSLRGPRSAINRGIGFLPEDRKLEGLIPSLSVRANLCLALQARQGWLRPLSLRRQQELADEYIAALRIATSDAEKPISQLSGGNQQKVILARWLAAQPELMVLDEPTRGVDVGARADIEALIARLAGEGMAFVLVSSELDEIVRSCHRVAVLRDRQMVGELTGLDLTAARIMAQIAGGTADA